MTTLAPFVFFGDSVFLAGIKAEFKIANGVSAITIEPQDPEAGELIRRHNPAVILFDLTAGPVEAALELLRDRPGLLLIGMAPSTDQVLLLSSRQATAFSAGELLDLIQSHTHAATE